MEKFFQRCKLSKRAQKEIDNLTKPISIKEVKYVFKNFPQRKPHAQMASLINSTEHLRD